jgi:ATP/maltotriose-dependent transcriptional regulator MalT
MPGATWIRDQGYSGPYIGKKWMYYVSEEGSTTHSTSRRSVNNNFRMLKFSSVVLWLAECEAELGNLDKAQEYTNMIRERAQKSTSQDASVNTKVGLYPASRRELADILRSLDITIVMVTHDLPYAFELCERSVILSGGIIVADGKTGQILNDEKLLKSHRLELPVGFSFK